MAEAKSVATQEEFPTIVTTRRVVPNLQPIAEPHPYRLAIIGEAPGEDEENHGYPFVGKSGNLLDRILREASIDRNRCFVGNICQVRPPLNKISAFDWKGPEIQSGLNQLKNDLLKFDPNICLLLGNSALFAARYRPDSISAWRGSLFRSDVVNSPMFGHKCIGAFHPAAVLRKFEGYPLLKMDVFRARTEACTKALDFPSRELLTNLDAGMLCYLMDSWPANLPCSVDIEGGLPSDLVNSNVTKDSKKRRHLNWKCVALSGRPTKAFAIPWWRFNEDEHCKLLLSFARLMGRLDVPKILQNSLYDSFVLAYGYHIHVRNVLDDTMALGWEKYCELPKGLGVLASVWTREPHWKDDEMYGGTGEQLAIGCCKDVAVTYEIRNAIPATLSITELAHYNTNIKMLRPALYMELRGIKYDQTKVNTKLDLYKKEIVPIGDRLSELSKEEVRGPSGCIADKRLAKLMYEKLNFPPQFAKDPETNRLTDKYTTDIEALLKLRRHIKPESDPFKFEFLSGVIRHRHLEGILETLRIKADSDGRVRCSYNVVGTETGRFSCKTSPTGAGANLTTITKELRDNYIADTDYDFFQCDLAGADGWTVAAHCLRAGDPTMFEDYIFGLKPAKILALLYTFGADVNKLDRSDLKWWSKGNKEKNGPFDIVGEIVGAGIYECCKVKQHGTNYLMGNPTAQINIMKKSFKQTGVPIYMEASVGEQLSTAYHYRYQGLRRWHAWAEAQLLAKGSLTSATGHTRIFFGRRFGRELHDTLKQFLADEPQQNTTWATNLAMLRLWNDPENRRKDGSLIIEPLHQVHDALCGQWPKAFRNWAITKVRSYFQNPLTIAGTTLTIPFEGGYGPSWGECTNPI